MATVTISRQMGSLGCDVAHILADLLGYRVVWRDLINQAARRAGAPEMALAAIDELGFLDICPSTKACEAYRNAVEQIMRELADEGDIIIVGRAGQVILQHYPDVLHVRLIAPTSLRAKRLAKRHGVRIEGAREQVKASDRYRTDYLQRFYNVQWGDPELYHLIINTGRVSTREAAMLIRQALELLQSSPDIKASSQQETCLEHTETKS